MKIGILNCLKANEVCAGAACLAAWNGRTKHFSRYGAEDELIAFARCNGCGRELRQDAGMQEKLTRLVSEGADCVHIGVCALDRAGRRCEKMEEMREWLEERGVEVVWGTH